MEPYGPIRFSFRDPTAPLWAMLVLGGALLLAGGLLAIVFLVEGTAGSSREDLIGVAVLLGLFLGGGGLATLHGLYNLVRRAEWHVTATHLYRARGASVVAAIELRGQPQPILTRIVRYGQLLSVRVAFGEPRWNQITGTPLVVPTMDAALAVLDAWKAQNR